MRFFEFSNAELFFLHLLLIDIETLAELVASLSELFVHFDFHLRTFLQLIMSFKALLLPLAHISLL